MNDVELERFWSKTDRSGNCWLWQGSKSNGYGVVKRSKKPVLVHRLIYEHFHGPIPKGHCVCHACDTPACINPAHLWLGTAADNMKDMAKKGRARNGVRYGADNHKSKMTMETARTVRQLYATKRYTTRELAQQYGVSQSTLNQVLNNKTWRERGN